MLVVFGIGILSSFLIPITIVAIDTNSITGFTIQIIIIYLVVSFGYSLIASWYANPNVVISPYYIQLGTMGITMITIMFHLVVINKLPTNIPTILIPIFVLFAVFGLYGYGITWVLRKLFSMSGESSDIHTESFRIEYDYDLLKDKLLGNEFFAEYNLEHHDKNMFSIAKRRISLPLNYQIVILLQQNKNSSNESFLSISATQIKFESLWNTENVKKIVARIRRNINGILDETYAIKLLPDETLENITNMCEFQLLESLQSPISRTLKTHRKVTYIAISLIVLGIVVTVLPFSSIISESQENDPNIKFAFMASIVSSWVSVFTTLAYIMLSDWKEKALKKIT